MRVIGYVFPKPCGARGEERVALHGLAKDGLPWTFSATQEQLALKGGARALQGRIHSVFWKDLPDYSCTVETLDSPQRGTKACSSPR